MAFKAFRSTLNMPITRFSPPPGTQPSVYWASQYFAIIAACGIIILPLSLVLEGWNALRATPGRHPSSLLELGWWNFAGYVAMIVACYGVAKLIVRPERRALAAVLGVVLTISSVVGLMRGHVNFGTVFGAMGFVLTLAAASTLRSRNASAVTFDSERG